MQLPRFFPRQDELPAAPPPPYAPTIVQLAHFAVGDVETAHRLAAEALATTSSPRDAVRALAELLPRKMGSWPAAKEIPETPESALELFSKVASWKPRERLALVLHLVARLPHQELDDWTGAGEITDRLPEIVDEPLHSSGKRPDSADSPACRLFAHSLLDVDDAEHGRNLRLHTLGCANCAARAEALRTRLSMLRESIQRVFPPELPRYAVRARRRAVGRGQRWQLRRISAACLVVLAVVLWLGRPTASPALTRQADSVPITAATLVERALNRVEAGPDVGTLHERARMGQGAEALVVERYTRLQAPHGMSLTLREAASGLLLLDLRTDGATRLWYSAKQRGGEPTTVSIDDARIGDMQPLLRNLPAVGSLGSFPSVRARSDIALLGAARSAGATLLGTTEVTDRPGYLLEYTDRRAERVVLTIDAETATLLRATTAPNGARGASQVLWQAEVVEIIPEAAAPELEIPPIAADDAIPNPRHLLLQPFSNTRLSDLKQQYADIPMPSRLPADTALAYIRDGSLYGLIQVYEGPWATIAILSNYDDLSMQPPQQLTERTGSIRWRVLLDDPVRSMTQFEFASADDPADRSWLYVWHGQMDDQERLVLATQVLETISWVTPKEAVDLEEWFVPAGASEQEPSLR